MKNLTITKIQEITGGKLYNARYDTGREISAVVSDSRKVTEGCLFLCIKGEHVDGHDFARQAIADGASFVLAEKRISNLNAAYVVVPDMLTATQALAQYYRKSLDIKIVGVTGSVGKTSTKEFIASVLKKRYYTKKTRGNYNNQWGVPFTIFELTEKDEAAVIEMGISDFGEMDNLAKIVRPDIAVISNIGESHMEYFGSREGILRAKTEIFNYLDQGAHVVLNGDDDLLSEITDAKGIRPEFFGFNKNCSVSAENVREHGLEGSEFDVAVRDKGGKMSFHVHLPVPGRHMIYNALAATQVGIDMNVPVMKIKEGLEGVVEYEGRNNIIRTDHLTIIDDAYNASPASMLASIDLLKSAAGRKVAVMGDMFELGEGSDKYHFRVGQYAGKAGVDLIICIGENSEKMFMGAKLSSDNQVEYFKTLDDAMDMIPGMLRENDTVMVKASNSMHFDKVVEMLQKL